ncbi:MAG: DUF502 domain-containing protein [Porticoccaceae bacterium]|nr:DUF502 domain-containing protein [Porticoccaceae bacterium]
MKKFLITTLVGGALFLIPLAFLTWVLTRGFQLMIALVEPIAPYIPVDSVAGIGLVSLLALILLVFVCLITGLLARAKFAQLFYRRSDAVIGAMVPSYIWTKVVLKNLSGEGNDDDFKPVLVTMDDLKQIAFEMERAEDGTVVVFFPGAPEVQSGTVGFVDPERVEPLNTNLLALNNVLRKMGKGGAALLNQKK